MKILMVCMGNICRSPMAEGIMRDTASKNGLTCQIDSAGTINYHEGSPPDSRAIKKSKEHGIDISMLRARPFEVSDYNDFDLIYVMDVQNFKEVIRQARNDKDRAKVKMIMNEVFPDENIEVPDPYYGGEQGFENVFQMLTKACEVIAGKIKS